MRRFSVGSGLKPGATVIRSWQLSLVAGLMLAGLNCAGGAGAEGGSEPDGAETDNVGDEGSAGRDGAGGKCHNSSDCPGGFCSPLTGECVECTVDAHCADGRKCVSGKCLEGLACEPGAATCDENGEALTCNAVGTAWMPPESCDDETDCTLDSCIEGSGCLNSPDDNACNDGNECTLDDCLSGTGCTHEPDPDCGLGGVADPSPANVSFPLTVPGDQMSQKNVLINNSGLGPLLIFKAEIEAKETVFYLFEPPSSIVTLTEYEPALEVAPGSGASLTLAFVPEQLGEFNGLLEVYTNDATREGGVAIIPLYGKAVADNCIKADPASLDFGPREVGVPHTLDVKILNCGEGLIPIYELALTPDTDPEFSLVAALSPPYDLDLGQSTTISVGFKASVPDKSYSGKLVLKNGSPKTPELVIPFAAEGVAGSADCPIAVLTYAGPGEVPPLKPVELSGTGSYGLSGQVAGYAWAAEGPAGSHPAFAPNAASSKVTVKPDLCGGYLFKLDVTDTAGHQSCNTAAITIKAIPKEDIYVELLWSTPGDPNESDVGAGKGSDLDLHLAAPQAVGTGDHDGDGKPDGWFDAVWDCWSVNPSPNWGTADPAAKDDPALALADADGAGPEAVAYGKPEDGTYKVGVHYAANGAFGPANARLVVYVKQGKAIVTEPVELAAGDLWDAVRLVVDGFSITAVEVKTESGGRVILPDYPTK